MARNPGILDLGRSHDHTANHQWKTFKKSQKSCVGLQNQTYFPRGCRYICFGHPGEVLTQNYQERRGGGGGGYRRHAHKNFPLSRKVGAKTQSRPKNSNKIATKIFSRKYWKLSRRSFVKTCQMCFWQFCRSLGVWTPHCGECCRLSLLSRPPLLPN